MTQVILFAHPRSFDQATVDSGDWRAALPVTNLQDMQPSRVARTTNLTNTYFVAEFTTPGAIAANALALMATNLSAAATIQIRGATSEANLTAAPGYNSGSISAWPATGRPTDPGLTAWSVFKKWTNSTAYVWWRVDISDATNTDGYVQIGRAILAPAFQPTYGISKGWTRQHNPADVQVRTPFGHTLTQERLRPRSISVSLDFLSEAEWFDGTDELMRLRGLAGDLVCCLDADATTYLHKRLIHGVLSEVIPFSQPYVNLYAAKIGILELV